MSNGTSLLLGLQGVTVDRVALLADGTREVHVSTEDLGAAGCPSCGEISTSPKQWVTTRPRDLPYGEAPLVVVWRKRRWRCRAAGCARGSFTESIPQVPPRARVTTRVRRAIGAAVGDANRAVSEVAAVFGLSWPTAHAAVIDAADAALVEPEPTAVLGVDETRRGRPRWEHDRVTGRWTRIDRWDTGFHTGLTNARTEGINRIIKDVGRRACGFRNPDNHRRRVRFHCTRHTRRMPATPATKPG